MDIAQRIVAEILAQQEAMGWPHTVPAWATLPDAAGSVRYYAYKHLTVGLCEQLVEYHSRAARSIMAPGTRGLDRIDVAGAARHILLARLYRCTYIDLIGQEDSTEDDMPFAHNRW